MKRIFYSLLIPLLFFSACKVSWVPQYSAQLEERIANCAKANERLYLDMLDADDTARSYTHYKDRYNDIQSEISAIRLANEARKNNAEFIIINKNLSEAFAEAKNYHKSHHILSNGEIKAYQQSIAAFWRPLYFAEKGLKGD
ncbi:MAG: hypothetical protein JWN76_3806 [Chitinophagaceae bacterium]|nr:hypothetical protein [Chitinophagaceae bacterium]